MKKIERLPLRDFTRYCMSIAQVPSSYLAGLTIEEQLLWLCSFLTNEVIPTVNNNGEAVAELQELYIQLKEYVDNYFDNLDVQEEVNTKLEEMAQSGELAELISQYLEAQAIIGFNTSASLAEAQNLANGSFAKTYGREIYSDGQGAFYKIRTRLNSDVPDGYNIIALVNTDNLVAEKINYSSGYELKQEIDELDSDIQAENKKGDNFNLNLQSNIIYDLAVGETHWTQASCVIGSTLYVYLENNAPYGDILKFNISTGSYIETVSSKKLYHGNDMAAIGTNIYVAPAKDDLGALGNKKLVVFDTLTNSVSETEPFEDIEEDIFWGVAKYDENKLLCAFCNNNENLEKISNMNFYLYNITSGDITPLSITNASDTFEDFYYAHQSIEYLDGKIYMQTSWNDGLVEFDLVGTNANLHNIYNYPLRDNNNLILGELEGLSKCEIFGKNCLMLTAICQDNNFDNHRTVKAYIIDPVNNTPISNLFYPNENMPFAQSDKFDTKLKATSTSLFENGSENYPFKTLTRAIAGTKRKMATTWNIVILDSESYNAGIIDKENIAIIGYNGSHPTIKVNRILNSNISIEGQADDNRISFYANYHDSTYATFINSKIILKNTNIYLAGTTRVGFSHLIMGGVSVYKQDSFTSTSDPIWHLINQNTIQDSCDYSNVSTQTTWYNVYGDSILFAGGPSIPSNRGKITKGGTAFVIYGS